MVPKNIHNIHIPNLNVIKKECFDYINQIKQGNLDHRSGGNLRHSTDSDSREISTALYDYLKNNFNILPQRFTFYVTPPGLHIPPHIDGGGIKNLQDLSWYGLNIPIANTEKSETIFYKVDAENMDGRWPIDKTKIEVVESYTITKPVIINTSVLHSVENHNTEDTRIMLLIRWHPRFNFFKEVIKDENTLC